jgi:REP element-mobilizing transposase RayT
MIRGIDGRTIFCSVSDFVDFLERFGLLVRELGFQVLAWCLLGNHAHFILKTGNVPLATLMARLTARHAQRLNRTNGRVGHLFQARYKAVLIHDDGKLSRTSAYVLGNALRHGLVSATGLLDYRWSGYALLVGRREAFSFESVELIASALGVDRAHTVEFVREQSLAIGAEGAALEPDQIDELNLMIRDACREHSVPAEALRSLLPGARVRREILARAATSLDLPLRTIASEIGMSYRTARKISARLREGARGV